MSQEPTVAQLFDLTGKTAIVTGGTGYLGQSLSRALAEAGANVIVASRDLKRAQLAAAELPVHGHTRHLGCRLDHMDAESQLASDFQDAAAQYDSINILVNNGNEHCMSDLTTCTAGEFNRHLANATGYFLLARLLRNHSVECGTSASIILLGSMYGLVASYPDTYEGIAIYSPVAYHTLKGGILQMTRHLAAYWASDDVRVNALSPGPFPSPEIVPEMAGRLCTKSPMKRMGQPYELKGAVVFLASSASSYMTGQNLVIDGGWTAW